MCAAGAPASTDAGEDTGAVGPMGAPTEVGASAEGAPAEAAAGEAGARAGPGGGGGSASAGAPALPPSASLPSSPAAEVRVARLLPACAGADLSSMFGCGGADRGTFLRRLPGEVPRWLVVNSFGTAHFASCALGAAPEIDQPHACADIVPVVGHNSFSRMVKSLAARALSGLGPNEDLIFTPGRGHRYYSAEQLSKRLTEANKELRLANLGTRSLRFRIAAEKRHIDELESLMEAIAHSNFPRAHAVLGAARSRGLGVGATKDLLAKAIAGVYRPQASEWEYELLHAVWSMSGYNVATVLSKAIGLPSMTSLRRHGKLLQLKLYPASSYSDIVPSCERTLNNIGVRLQHSLRFHARVQREVLGTLMIDEVAILSYLRYDKTSNHVLGVACDPEVPVYELAMEAHLGALERDIGTGAAKLASLASVMGVAALEDGQPGLAMACMPISVSGVTGKGRTAERELATLAHLMLVAHENLQRSGVRVAEIGSDGDGPRSRIYVTLCVWPLPTEEEKLLEGVKRIDKRTMFEGITMVRDSAHLTKRQVQIPRVRGRKFGSRPEAHRSPIEVKNAIKLAGHLDDIAATSMLNPADKMRVSVAQLMKLHGSRYHDLPL